MKNKSHIYHIARFALEEKQHDLVLYLERILENSDGIDIDSSEKVRELLKKYKKSNTTFRSSKTAPTPVDLETRLELIRLNRNPKFDFEPIWEEGVLDKLEQIVVERKQKKGLLKKGLVPTKSVIFTGAPGVGKSLAAKWLADKLDYPLLTLDLSAVMSSLLGRTGSNLRSVLDFSKSFECVLLLDEIDAIAKKRDDNTDVGELKRLVTVILQEIEEWPSTSLLVAATNHPKLLDPAVWRRFDLSIDFPLPDESNIQKAITLYLGNKVRVKKNILSVLSKIFKDNSYSDIERILLRIRKKSALSGISLEDAIIDYLSKNSQLMNKDEKIKLSEILVNSGFSQRKSSDITGVSRDTIRRKLSE